MSQHLPFGLLTGWLNVFTLFQALFHDRRGTIPSLPLLNLSKEFLMMKEGLRSTRGKTSPGVKPIGFTFSTPPFYAWLLAYNRTKQLA